MTKKKLTAGDGLLMAVGRMGGKLEIEIDMTGAYELEQFDKAIETCQAHIEWLNKAVEEAVAAWKILPDGVKRQLGGFNLLVVPITPLEDDNEPT